MGQEHEGVPGGLAAGLALEAGRNAVGCRLAKPSASNPSCETPSPTRLPAGPRCLDPDAFARHLGGLVTDEDTSLAAFVASLHLHLYLACACLQALPGAVDIFERELSPVVYGVIGVGVSMTTLAASPLTHER